MLKVFPAANVMSSECSPSHYISCSNHVFFQSFNICALSLFLSQINSTLTIQPSQVFSYVRSLYHCLWYQLLYYFLLLLNLLPYESLQFNENRFAPALEQDLTGHIMCILLLPSSCWTVKWIWTVLWPSHYPSFPVQVCWLSLHQTFLGNVKKSMVTN